MEENDKPCHHENQKPLYLTGLQLFLLSINSLEKTIISTDNLI